MKKIKTSMLFLSVLLALSLLLVACSGKRTDGEETTVPTPEQTAPGGTETESRSLAGYTVVYASYAANWEKEAAKTVAALIGGSATSDSTEPSAKEILIGAPERKETRDFDYDVLERNGYALAFVGEGQEKILLAANSECGMESVVALFTDKLTDGKIPLSAAISVTQKEESDMLQAPNGTWGESLAYANQIQNGISAGFTDQLRTGFLFSNTTMRLSYRLAGKEIMPVSFTNAYGIPYYESTGDAYVVDSAGNRIYASNSQTAARMNTYRMGYYYRDIHFLDQTFTNIQSAEEGKTYKVAAINRVGYHMITEPQADADGVISFDVTDTTDPYVTFKVKYATKEYNAVRIVLRCESSTTAHLYFSAGSHSSYNNEQLVSFTVMPGEEFVTYDIYLADQVDYTGNVRGIRLDIGSVKSEHIEIKSIEAVKVEKTGVCAALDRVYHVYADKLHEELHLVMTEEEQNLTEYGTEIRIPVSRVKAMSIVDANGTHASLAEADMTRVEAVAFDISRAGVIGWIRSVDSDNARFSIALAGDEYVIRLYETVTEQTLKKGTSLRLGWRLYNSDSHSFEEFLSEAYIERHPLTDLQVTDTADGAAYLGYDANRGCYTYKVNGTGFNIYYEDKQRNFKICSSLQGDAYKRKLYILGSTDAGGLENAVLLTGDNQLLAMPVEVCKNFCGENEEPIYDPGDPSYGEALFPLILQANEKREFTLIHLYTNWGQFPIKQLSSIQFIAPYYHLSCGTTESNCIAPYYVYGKDFWTLPDFRSMSAPFWSGQPQHTSVGRLYFLRYTDASGTDYGSEAVSDRIDSSGPVYADITMDYVSDDGKLAATYRHLEFPQYDENRTCYEIRIEVLEDLEIKDFVNQFSFFSFDGRDVAFSKMGYLNENNQEVVENLSGQVYTDYLKLGTDCPYFDFFIGNKSDYVNFAMLIKSAKLVIGGKECTSAFTVKHSFDGSLNHCSLTLDLGDVTLRAGDTLSIDLVLLPWGSQNATDDTSVRTVRQDTCLAPVTVDASTGSVIADAYMPKVKSENGTAVFTLKNGGGTTGVRVYGFEAVRDTASPIFYELVNGEWVVYNTAYHGYDGYMLYYDADGTYSVAFCVDMEQGTERTFKVEME